MLRLHAGAGMRHLASRFRALGFSWAYRVVDTPGFGLPHRRRRIYIVASRDHDPARVLFSDEAGTEQRDELSESASATGFYWTEGNRGVGRAADSVPPLKGGSSWGIPSPPAIFVRAQRRFVTPTIGGAERLQGLPNGWTAAASRIPGGEKARWQLVGNAVSVPIAEWIGRPSGCVWCADLRDG